MYWQAQFPKPCKVSRVKIRNRKDNGDALSDLKVMIDDEGIGRLPGSAHDEKWFNVTKTTETKGSSVRLITPSKQYLSFQSIMVFTKDKQVIEEHLPLDDIDDYQKVETIHRKVSGQPYSKVFRKVKGKIKALVEETTDEKAMFEEDFDSSWLEFQSAMKNV